MSMGCTEEYEREAAAKVPVETKQYDIDTTITTAVHSAGDENAFPYTQAREMLFEVLQSTTLPHSPIWISERASQRALELREEYKRSGTLV